MADVHSAETRSYNMSCIRSKDTKPEIFLRKILFSHGFRFRVHNKLLPGKPDIVLKKYNTVIFVNGCYWHGHKGCYRIPQTNTEWWVKKIGGNILRDKKNTKLLKVQGWNVLRVYECELKKNKLEKTINRIITNLYKNKRC